MSFKVHYQTGWTSCHTVNSSSSWLQIFSLCCQRERDLPETNSFEVFSKNKNKPKPNKERLLDTRPKRKQWGRKRPYVYLKFLFAQVYELVIVSMIVQRLIFVTTEFSYHLRLFKAFKFFLNIKFIVDSIYLSTGFYVFALLALDIISSNNDYIMNALHNLDSACQYGPHSKSKPKSLL